MKIEDVISILDKANVLRFEQQPALQVYAHDKSVPLEDRFKAWMRHCDKYHYPNGDIDFVDKMAAIDKAVLPTRTGILTTAGILSYYCRNNDDIKELLIEENFGSFYTQ